MNNKVILICFFALSVATHAMEIDTIHQSHTKKIPKSHLLQEQSDTQLIAIIEEFWKKPVEKAPIHHVLLKKGNHFYITKTNNLPDITQDTRYKLKIKKNGADYFSKNIFGKYVTQRILKYEVVMYILLDNTNLSQKVVDCIAKKRCESIDNNTANNNLNHGKRPSTIEDFNNMLTLEHYIFSHTNEKIVTEEGKRNMHNICTAITTRSFENV